MAANVSKRQQARNEKDLHELLQIPGNNECADCGAKNPGWASWSLGVFICMRCASIHRKLGTHISKVKSLSMDTWSAEQVETMRQTGNIAVNRIYNPKNRKPEVPLDAEEVDSVMEKFIRKKYQEKSLADGKPELPRRDTEDRAAASSYPRDTDNTSPPPLPVKKGKKFGFSLRSSSAAHPFSRHDKKKWQNDTTKAPPPPPPPDRPTTGNRLEVVNMKEKLIELREMGFPDGELNADILRQMNGDMEQTVASLVQLGAGTAMSPPAVEADDRPGVSNNPYAQMAGGTTFGLSKPTPPEPPKQIAAPPPTTYASNNMYQQPPNTQGATGLEQNMQNLQVTQPLFPHNTGGYSAAQPAINDLRFQSMTPPAPYVVQQYGYQQPAPPAASSTPSNPFYQSMTAPPPQPTQTYGAPLSSSGVPTQSNNPFLNYNSSAPPVTTPSQTTSFNPFGLPPPPQPSPPAVRSVPAASNQPSNPFLLDAPITSSNQVQSVNTQMSMNQPYVQPTQPPASVYEQLQRQQSQSAYAQQPSQTSHPVYAQLQRQQSQNLFGQQADQQPHSPFTPSHNPQQYFNEPPRPQLFQQSSFQQQAPPPQSQQQTQPPAPQQQTAQFQQQTQQPAQQVQAPAPPQIQSPPPQPPQQQQSMMPQLTGRYDKQSILALYNLPRPNPPSQQHSNYSELSEQSSQAPADAHEQPQQPSKPYDPFANTTAQQFQQYQQSKRAVTMPFMSPTSAATTKNPFPPASPPSMDPNQGPAPMAQSRNPFLNSANTSGNTSPAPRGGQGYLGQSALPLHMMQPRHASNDSVLINNLDSGRHSPDAFASLSSRHMR